MSYIIHCATFAIDGVVVCLWCVIDTWQGGQLRGYVYLLVECVDGLVG